MSTATRFDEPFGTDDEFFADIVRSDVFACEVGQILLLAGLHVTKPPLQIRPNRSRASAYNDGGIDLYIGSLGIQVKERSGYTFSGPEDFPYPSIIFDTTSGFDRYRASTAAYVMYCPARRGFVIVPSSSYPKAEVITRTDGRNQHAREFATMPISETWDIGRFVQEARKRPSCRR